MIKFDTRIRLEYGMERFNTLIQTVSQACFNIIPFNENRDKPITGNVFNLI